jgi:hypothetical protein
MFRRLLTDWAEYPAIEYSTQSGTISNNYKLAACRDNSRMAISLG